MTVGGAWWPATVLVLAGCAGSPAPVPAAPSTAAPVSGPTVYTCADSVRFSTRPRGDSIVVLLPEGSSTLPHEPSASGARYSAGGITFWSKGETATLERNGARSTDCRGRPGGTPWEEAMLLGVDFRAVGQEPGWVLDLDEGHWLRYVGDYGGTTVAGAAPAPEPVPGGDGVRYRLRRDGRDFLVTIHETPCQDAMSGQAFTHMVVVRLDGQEVNGCGRAVLSGEVTERYWKLIELDGTPAVVGPEAREAHLRLRAEGSKVAGSTGCNSLSGSFEQDGDRVRFGRMVTTLMACTDPALMTQEQQFLQMLERVDHAAVAGDDLTLYAGDEVLARFTAVYFR